VEEHTYGQLLILTLGVNEMRSKERLQHKRSAKSQEKPNKATKLKKPMKEMTGIEYMNWLNRAGKGRI